MRHLLVVALQRLDDPNRAEQLRQARAALEPRGDYLGQPEISARVQTYLDHLRNPDGLLALIDAISAETPPEPTQTRRDGTAVGRAASASPAETDRPRPLESVLADLDALVGLDEVKEAVHALVDLHQVNEHRKSQGLPVIPVGLHLVFAGNPGTGKTTVARIVGEVYRALGLLSKGHTVEVQRADLVAGYVGQTALKVAEVVRRAIGGVLFIDEAYALAPSSDQDYGGEAVATLVKMMEDHRDDLAVIAAGYEREMERFIRSNPGLRSRFQRFIRFPDFSTDELMLIFEKYTGTHGFALTPPVRRRVQDWLVASVRSGATGNARMVRNLFEQMYTAMAVRVAADNLITTEEMQSFVPADVPAPPNEPEDTPGMYL